MVFGDGLDGKLIFVFDVIVYEFGYVVFSGMTKNKVVRYLSVEIFVLNEGLVDFWGI